MYQISDSLNAHISEILPSAFLSIRQQNTALTKQLQTLHFITLDSDMESEYRRIGQGFCGTVWASEHSLAHKREDGGPGRSLYNDFLMHGRAYKALSALQSQVVVPVCHKFVPLHDHSWWDEQKSSFPVDYQVPCNILITERIRPFSKLIRDTITDLYCPEALRSSIKSSEPDQDCLIRAYLGRRRRSARQSRFQAFSLRNYPLHIDQMEEMKLDTFAYARIMAETLANLHWSARIDANDVEFVLAPSPREEDHLLKSTGAGAKTSSATTIESHILGDHAVWILDFDCCRDISLDEAGVKQAVAAFYKNDPFFPRPRPRPNRGDDDDDDDDVKDQRLWDEFKDEFLRVSEGILGPGTAQSHLPRLWVRLVEERGQG